MVNTRLLERLDSSRSSRISKAVSWTRGTKLLPVGEVDTLVRDLAVAVTEDARRMPAAMVERLKAHFSEEQIVELTLRATL